MLKTLPLICIICYSRMTPDFTITLTMLTSISINTNNTNILTLQTRKFRIISCVQLYNSSVEGILSWYRSFVFCISWLFDRSSWKDRNFLFLRIFLRIRTTFTYFEFSLLKKGQILIIILIVKIAIKNLNTIQIQRLVLVRVCQPP